MPTFNKILAIDLGTEHTTIYLQGKGILLREPTVLAVTDENKVKAVGHKAKEMYGKTPNEITVHYPMKNGVITDTRIVEAIVHLLISKAMGIKSFLFKPIVVVSRPTNITSTQKRALVESVRRAGAKDVYTVPNTVAAALGVGLAIDDLKGHMIANLGAGISDIAVISLGGIVETVSIQTSGDDIDDAIMKHILDKHKLKIGKKTAEKVKKSICSATTVDKEFTINVKGNKKTTGLPHTIKVSTNELVEPIFPYLKNIIDAAAEVLRKTPPELSSDIIDNGIVLTGGLARLKNIDKFVKKYLRIPSSVAEEPEYSVIEGLGYLSEHIDRYKNMLLSK